MEETRKYTGIGPETAQIRILLFSGTTEGRRLAESLKELPVYVYVSTATEYGKECTGTGENIESAAGRMDEADISRFLISHKIDLAVDATHPFARAVTENIQNACRTGGAEYIRCLREQQDMKVCGRSGGIFKRERGEGIDCNWK